MTIAVEKNIPIPPEKKRNVYPYKVMEIGESFFVPTGKLQICLLYTSDAADE